MSFGTLGVDLTKIGLGTMPLAIQKRPSLDDAVRVIHRALDAGINWFDTADSYCLDDSDTGYGERLLAKALADRKAQDVVVTTKAGYVRPHGEWVIDGRPERIKSACDASLAALGTSCIFLYLLHAPDPNVPLAETVGALSDLQKQGKIRYIGLSNVDAGHVREAQKEAEVSAVQNRCNLFEQWSFTNGVVDYCRIRRIPFIAHSPLGGHKGHVRTLESPVIRAIAERRGATPHEVCLMWLLNQGDHVFAIPGASRRESLESSLRILDDSLSDTELRELSKAFPAPHFPRRGLIRTRDELRRIGRTVRNLVR